MPQNRILYNVQDLYVGPSRDDLAVLLPNQHLLQRIYRVQAIGYNINLNRSDVKELGDRNIVDIPPINHPEISFEFEYYLAGVSNEVKMGLNVNWNYTGVPSPHVGNTGVSLISGFSDGRRQDDKRNFYVAINQSGSDGHATYLPYFGSGYSGFSLSQFVDPFSPNYHLLSFVNSYLININYNMSVGNFPTARASYIADNMVYFVSGSGVPVPKLLPTNKSGLFSDYKVAIPRHYNDGLPAALRPGDVTVSITSTGYGPSIKDLGFDMNDVKIQSCEINVELPREKLEFLGSYSPVDRPIIFPVPVTMSIDVIAGDLGSGDISNLRNRDLEFNTSISVRNSLYNIRSGQHIAFLMDLKRAKLISVNSRSSIQGDKVGNLLFKTELNPDDLSRGLFVSGIIPSLSLGGQVAGNNNPNLPPDVIVTPPDPDDDPPIEVICITNELITEDGIDIITTEDGEPIADEPTIYNPGLF